MASEAHATGWTRGTATATATATPAFSVPLSLNLSASASVNALAFPSSFCRTPSSRRLFSRSWRVPSLPSPSSSQRKPISNTLAEGEAPSATSPTASTAASPNGNGQAQSDSLGDDSQLTYRLTAGERARTLVRVCKSGTLCTSSVRHSGVPFGSHVDFVQDSNGDPVFLLAANANHTRNLASEPSCSLFCQPAFSAGQDGCRATLVGRVVPLTDDDSRTSSDGNDDDLETVAELKELYVETHAHATEALRFSDLFKFYRMRVEDVHFVSGYGVLSQWVAANSFASANPDGLAFDAPDILKHFNENKESDLKRLCRVFLGVEDATSCSMTSLDCLGFDIRVRDSHAEISEFRVGFRESVSSRFDVQSALVKAFQEAWERENGFDETWEGEDTRPTILYIRTY